MNGLLILIVGFVAGCMIASGVWAILWFFSKKDRHEDAPGTEIMKDIASECAEIENSIVSEGLKKISKSEFQSSISPRLEKITKKLSTNLNSFDVYYVKYIETLIAKYRQALLSSDNFTQPVPELKQSAVPAEKDAEIILPMPQAKPVDAKADLLPEPEHFDQTWQMDFSKSGHERTRFEKNPAVIIKKEDVELSLVEESVAAKAEPPSIEETLPINDRSAPEKVEETVLDRVSLDPEMKDTKIIKTENIPEEKQSEIEKIIIAELSREPADKKDKKRLAEAVEKEKTTQPIPIFEDVKAPEPAVPPQKVVPKEEKTGRAADQKDEHFISGEDLVAKLDSFFGIQD